MIKQEIRNYFKIKSKLLSDEYIITASEKISRYVTELPEFNSANTVFVYINMPDEPWTKEIIEKAWSRNKTVCVPKCIGKSEMIPVIIKGWNDVCPGKMGISEPIVCSDTVDREKIDIAIIPCVSADRKGNRLGHGAGYYDRFLTGTHMKKICLCFEENISEEIPTDGNDVTVDVVISEKGIYRIR